MNTTEPGPCEGMKACDVIITIWAVGVNGICYPDTYGYLLGEGGFTGIWIEVRMNCSLLLNLLNTFLCK